LQIGEKGMDYQLTNEKIRKKFASQFDLVNYAIKLAENMIMTGRDPRVKIDSHNRSMQVLTEIISDKDRFDEIRAMEQEEQEPGRHEESQHKFSDKGTERKKSRKVFAE
jgi:hypothetical protein